MYNGTCLTIPFWYLFLFTSGVIFISFLNKLDPALIPLLISVQILFAIAFRNFFEYLVFAIGSLLLVWDYQFLLYKSYRFCQPSFFVLVSCLVTSFTGAYVWLTRALPVQGQQQQPYAGGPPGQLGIRDFFAGFD